MKRMKRHKHAELIIAWANGAAIEFKSGGVSWELCIYPAWYESQEFRIKPEPKPDTDHTYRAYRTMGKGVIVENGRWEKDNLKLTFEGETGQLKSAEVIK